VKTLWLVGMMGAGKSAVGPLLAQQLDRPYLDTDAEVENEAGATIAELFAREGEAAFRKRERGALEAVAGREVVVALGGGAIAQPGAGALLAATGRIVYLRARPETLLARIADAESRPLLAGLDAAARLARITDLLAQRAPHYEAATLVIDTDGCTPEDVARRVLRGLEAGA
jgi:shikimate kinase